MDTQRGRRYFETAAKIFADRNPTDAAQRRAKWREIAEKYSMPLETAWFMAERYRELQLALARRKAARENGARPAAVRAISPSGPAHV
jgi:hypothetical protein